jgi:hypothetical protein
VCSKILILLKHVFRSNALIVFRFEVFYAGIIHLSEERRQGVVIPPHQPMFIPHTQNIEDQVNDS